MTDAELLQKYVHGSQDAFAEIVRRYVAMVGAAATRQTRDAEMAEDVTQAVFIILARRAASLRERESLAGWLVHTTHYACMNAVKLQQRRRVHEQRAAMDPAAQDTGDSQLRVADMLDTVMAELKSKDRDAVALRFLMGKQVNDVGAAMGVSPQAAQKRISRALEKLRAAFSRRGVTSPAGAIESALLALPCAPVTEALVANVMAGSLSAGASASVGMLAKATIHSITWVNAKLAAAACLIVVVGAGVVVAKKSSPTKIVSAQLAAAPVANSNVLTFSAKEMWQPYKPDESTGSDIVKFKNGDFKAPFMNTPAYFASLDAAETRPGGSGEAASVIRTAANAANTETKSLGVPVIPIEKFHGKRVRLSGYVKSDSIDGAGGLAMWIFEGDKVVAHDNLADRHAVGTTDWTRYDIVSDVPAGATKLILQTQLRGSGTVWSDGLEFAVVGKDVPLSDDHTWRSWCPRPGQYRTTLDKDVQHNGAPTIRVSSGSALRTDWSTYDRTIYDIEKFRGKRARLTAMLKCENVTGSSGPTIRVVGPDFATLAVDDHRGSREGRGTREFRSYSTMVDVPKNATAISPGVVLNARGTIWFTDLQLQVVDEP